MVGHVAAQAVARYLPPYPGQESVVYCSPDASRPLELCLLCHNGLATVPQTDIEAESSTHEVTVERHLFLA